MRKVWHAIATRCKVLFELWDKGGGSPGKLLPPLWNSAEIGGKILPFLRPSRGWRCRRCFGRSGNGKR
ncbi:hypothetical protein L0337_39390 [candidate division KSB1 bacterium]|nr:hypothetical protein [candidate division KSB1 bacterium]